MCIQAHVYLCDADLLIRSTVGRLIYIYTLFVIKYVYFFEVMCFSRRLFYITIIHNVSFRGYKCSKINHADICKHEFIS